MAVDGGEKAKKDMVTIAWLHEVSQGVYFTEHDFGSTSTSFVAAFLIVTINCLAALGPY
jgi:hypothetical protein